MSHIRPPQLTARLRSPMPFPAAPLRAMAPRGPPPPPQRLPTPRHPLPVARNRLPQFLPVLQPPIFPRENELYDEETYAEEYEVYQTTSVLDQRRRMTRQRARAMRAIPSLHRHTRSPRLFGFRYPRNVY